MVCQTLEWQIPLPYTCMQVLSEGGSVGVSEEERERVWE